MIRQEREVSAEIGNAIVTVQFLVGALVTFGGASFVTFAISIYGKSIGSIHLTIGIVGLVGAFLALRPKPWSRNFLIAINGLTIGYSSFSESLVYIQSLLPDTASLGSLIGTIIAIIMSCTIIYFLFRNKTSLNKKTMNQWKA
jgi:hypothetical protein